MRGDDGRCNVLCTSTGPRTPAISRNAVRAKEPDFALTLSHINAATTAGATSSVKTCSGSLLRFERSDDEVATRGDRDWSHNASSMLCD